MAQMFSISDNESETSEDREDPDQTEHNSGLPQGKQLLTVPDSLKGKSVTRACGKAINTRHFCCILDTHHCTFTRRMQRMWRTAQTWICVNLKLFFLWIISVLALVLTFKDDNEPNLFYMKKYLNSNERSDLIRQGSFNITCHCRRATGEAEKSLDEWGSAGGRGSRWRRFQA